MRVFIFVFVVLCWACSVKPEPLMFGKDQCYSCKMILMDERFGAELVTKKGKVYKFDDVNCLFQFYNDTQGSDDFQYKLVIDFLQPKKLINAEEASYLQSPNIKSPMASQVAAFESENAANKLLQEWQAQPFTWSELKNVLHK